MLNEVHSQVRHKSWRCLLGLQVSDRERRRRARSAGRSQQFGEVCDDRIRAPLTKCCLAGQPVDADEVSEVAGTYGSDAVELVLECGGVFCVYSQ